MYDIIYLGQPPITQWFQRRSMARKASSLPALPEPIREDQETEKKPPLRRNSTMNQLGKGGPRVSTTKPAMRRSSTRSSISDGGSPLATKCHEMAVGSETITLIESDNRLKLLSVEAGARLLGNVSRESIVGCSDTHIIHFSSRGTTVTGVRDKGQIVSSLAGISVKHLCAGHGYSVICTNEGKVFTWGKGDHGCLGHGDTESRSEPQQVQSLPFTVIIHVSAAFCHTSMVSSDGEVYMCGSGGRGQLGTGSTSDMLTPVGLDVTEHAKMACCGGDEQHPFTLILTADGVVLSTGDGENGKLGIGGKWSKKSLSFIGRSSFGDRSVANISAGVDHSLALTTDKLVYMWGLITAEDRHGVVRTRVENLPKQVEHPQLEDLVPTQIFAGNQFSAICGHSRQP